MMHQMQDSPEDRTTRSVSEDRPLTDNHPARGIAVIPTFTGRRSRERIPQGPPATPTVKVQARGGTHEVVAGEVECADLLRRMRRWAEQDRVP